MDTLQQVKHWAECGWTQADCAQALGLSYEKFREWLRLQSDFTWPKGRTIGQRSAVCFVGSPAQMGHLADMRQARANALPHYTVQGVTGTYVELAERFSSVSPISVWRRLQRGWDIERALFTPSQKSPADRPGYNPNRSFGNGGR